MCNDDQSNEIIQSWNFAIQHHCPSQNTEWLKQRIIVNDGDQFYVVISVHNNIAIICPIEREGEKIIGRRGGVGRSLVYIESVCGCEKSQNRFLNVKPLNGYYFMDQNIFDNLVKSLVL